MVLHHYVPRFYLARFSGESGNLWVYDKQSDRIFRSNPVNLAAQRNFYNISGLVPPGEDHQLLEKQLAAIESTVSVITGDWISKLPTAPKVDISRSQRDEVSLYLSLQLVRTAEYRAQVADSHQTTSEPHDVDGETVIDLDLLHTAIIWDEEFVYPMADAISDCVWMFGLNNSNEPFYTSDHPALVKSSGDSPHWLVGPVVSVPKMYLTYPLSPTLILYCFGKDNFDDPKGTLREFDGTHPGPQLTEEMAHHQNLGQIGMSRRFIYSNDNAFPHVKEMLERQPNLRNL